MHQPRLERKSSEYKSHALPKRHHVHIFPRTDDIRSRGSNVKLSRVNHFITWPSLISFNGASCFHTGRCWHSSHERLGQRTGVSRQLATGQSKSRNHDLTQYHFLYSFQTSSVANIFVSHEIWRFQGSENITMDKYSLRNNDNHLWYYTALHPSP